MSQNRVLELMLRQRRCISPMDALKEAGSFRLSERIRELERAGMRIERGWHGTPSGARVRSYRMAG